MRLSDLPEGQVRRYHQSLRDGERFRDYTAHLTLAADLAGLLRIVLHHLLSAVLTPLETPLGNLPSSRASSTCPPLASQSLLLW
jgi:hypothetical protein